jgi:uncharacterized protein YmfQ (DUF2313 family)
LDVDAYHQQLIALSPPGLAWNVEEGSEYSDLLYVFAKALAEFDGDVTDIFLNELNPLTATKLLSDWERLLGLPDACSPANQTLQQRREAAYGKWMMHGGQSKAYFIGLAKAMGYDITITTFKPFICGLSRCGDALNPVGMRFVWKVSVPGVRTYRFRVGQSVCGEKLLTIASAAQLECVFKKLQPSHSHLVFSYS